MKQSQVWCHASEHLLIQGVKSNSDATLGFFVFEWRFLNSSFMSVSTVLLLVWYILYQWKWLHMGGVPNLFHGGQFLQWTGICWSGHFQPESNPTENHAVSQMNIAHEKNKTKQKKRQFYLLSASFLEFSIIVRWIMTLETEYTKSV